MCRNQVLMTKIKGKETIFELEMLKDITFAVFPPVKEFLKMAELLLFLFRKAI